MQRFRAVLVLLLVAFPWPALATERDDVDRVIVVGDVHGDYEQFVNVLRDAGVINKRERWRAGDAHLVQIGDLPDRGPESHRAIRLLQSLERQAKRAGGEVHALIGNHETMVMRGDLRYVHPGEYAGLVDSRSERRQDDYFEKYVAYVKRTTPEAEWPAFGRAYRDEWNQRFPLGYVEHRQAWSADGEFGGWVKEHDTLLRIDDSLFVHGGLDPAAERLPIQAINEQIRAELLDARSSDDDSIINRADSPLWYRGLAVLPETEENRALLDAMLAYYGVKRIVIAHTPLLGSIVPRFGGRVLVADVGLSAHYGRGRAILLIEDQQPFVLLNGARVELPPYDSDIDAVEGYLRTIAPQLPKPEKVTTYLEALRRGIDPE
ncbi:MAG: metallophosphoesterase [Woeseiaceae bacterium]